MARRSRLLLSLALATAACRGPAPRAAPDVVIVTVDTLRPDRIGAWGHAGAQTPTLDALAAGGTVFASATAPLPRTTPALASLLTGLWAHHHGCRDTGRLVTGGTDLGEVLRDAGWQTMAVSANAVAAPGLGLGPGFQEFPVLPGRPAGEVVERALELVSGADEARPLLLWVHFVDPHFPYAPPAPYGDRPAVARCLAVHDDAMQTHGGLGPVFADVGGAASAVHEDCLAAYDAEIAYTDASLARLLRGLRRAGRLDHALLVVTADHGELLGEDGHFYTHGATVHRRDLEVPLVFSGPGVAAARWDADPVSLVDVMPTVLEYVGIPEARRPAMDGRSLARRLQGDDPEAPERVVFAESGGVGWSHQFDHVLTGNPRARLCLNGARFSLCSEQGGEPRLYDHEADPLLVLDVSERWPEERQRLVEAVDRWTSSTARQRSARRGALQLVEIPLLEGGFRREARSLAGPGVPPEALEAAHAEELQHLAALLDRWAADIPRSDRRDRLVVDEEALRALGYID